MSEFVSEAIEPIAPPDANAMSRGEPGLPSAFKWRDAVYAIVGTLDAWKTSAAEGGKPGGERYLRRHYHLLQMDNGDRWTVYCLRQAPRSARKTRQRWFLYSVAADRST